MIRLWSMSVYLHDGSRIVVSWSCSECRRTGSSLRDAPTNTLSVCSRPFRRGRRRCCGPSSSAGTCVWSVCGLRWRSIRACWRTVAWWDTHRKCWRRPISPASSRQPNFCMSGSTSSGVTRRFVLACSLRDHAWWWLVERQIRPRVYNPDSLCAGLCF